MYSFQLALWRSAFATAEAGMATAITLAHRLPMLAMTPFEPTPARLAEAQRMSFEKLAAVTDGTIAASQASALLITKVALGHVAPENFATAMLAISEAAARPARKRVSKNARRLSARRKAIV